MATTAAAPTLKRKLPEEPVAISGSTGPASKKPKLQGNRKKYEKKISYKKEKYRRGAKVNYNKMDDKKLRGEMRRMEGQYKEALDKVTRNEILLTEQPGTLEAEGGLEKTWKFSQKDIKKAVDVQSASKIFNLDLPKFGPYTSSYLRNGRHLLLAGKKGHVALMDWTNNRVLSELFLNETVHDVTFLHNETMFAVAQKRAVYIYDKTGAEIHYLKNQSFPFRLNFLPYHFLLCSVGKLGILHYRDTSTGQIVADHRTRLGPCKVMEHNPSNAIMHLGHNNGTVTLWSPNMNKPLAKMLCHRGAVKDLDISRDGRHIVTTGMDGRLKIWDSRTYKPMQEYVTGKIVETVNFSQKGLLSVGFSSRVEVWQNFINQKSKEPYMTHNLPMGGRVTAVRFCPFEDVLGISHDKGFSSIIVPGAGEANFDTYEANPFETKSQRREGTVQKLMEKIPADTITLDQEAIGNVTRTAREVYLNDKQTEWEANHPRDTKKKEKNKMRGKNKAGKKVSRKQQNVIVSQREKYEKERRDQEKANVEGKIKEKEAATRGDYGALDRFKK